MARRILHTKKTVPVAGPVRCGLASEVDSGGAVALRVRWTDVSVLKNHGAGGKERLLAGGDPVEFVHCRWDVFPRGVTEIDVTLEFSWGGPGCGRVSARGRPATSATGLDELEPGVADGILGGLFRNQLLALNTTLEVSARVAPHGTRYRFARELGGHD